MACVEFCVNGRKCIVDQSIPRETTLNAYLRYHLGLPGTKAMCREGGCGACVVTVRRDTNTFSVNSCLVLVFSCGGWDITTIEGLGNKHDGYNEIQKRMAAFNATQCGYCTPAWCMQLHSLRDKHLTMAELEYSFGSNTCRCTGFRPILDAIKSFAVDASPDLCQTVRDIEDLDICSKNKPKSQRKSSIQCLEDEGWDVVSEIDSIKKEIVGLNSGETKFYKVFEQHQIFDILNVEGYDSYMLIDGNTAKGIYETFEYPRVLIDISDVKSLKQFGFDQNLVFGANISLQKAIDIFREIAQHYEEFKYLETFFDHLKLVAHIPVRNLGSFAGNLMTKHAMPMYQSDVFLLLEGIGAMLTISDFSGSQIYVKMTDFLHLDMKGRLITNILMPPLSYSYIFKSYKIMPRTQNALAIVNAAFLLKINKLTKIISDARIVFGNISPSFIHAENTEKYLIGKDIFYNNQLQTLMGILSQELNPVENPPEPSPECRKKLALGLFYKFILNISPKDLVIPRFQSGGSLLHRPVSRGTQDFQTDPTLYPLNQPVQKLEGLIQSTGEARYVNDLPNIEGQVFAAFVLSAIHVGEIDMIDASEALTIKGVLAFYTAKDIPGKNSFTSPESPLQNLDEEILVSGQIKYYGQPVAVIVAVTEELATRVAKKVKVTYKNVSTKPPVLTIDEAKKDSKRYVPFNAMNIVPKGRGTDVKHTIKGVCRIESQYHYFMETLNCVVVPVDAGLEVYDAAQDTELTQLAVAQSLNLKQSDVHIKVRRLGGGFGGKISRNVQVAAACSLVASKLNVPCRFVLPMQTNMAAMGKRFPAQCEYEVAVDDNGKIQYLDATIIEDKGCSLNETILFILTVAGFKNCYSTDFFNLKMAAVLTDTPSHTSTRGPGTTEGVTFIEHIMQHIAFTVKRDPTDVRLINMRPVDNDLPSLVETIKKDSDFEKRSKEIEQFNKSNRWRKKAISLNLMNFEINFLGNYTAMVSLYRDGTVTVTTAGIEMGQGLNTKVAQVCAYELGIPLESVTILPVYSFVVVNSIVTGGSFASESVCFATIKACKIIKDRLSPLRVKMNNPTWIVLVKAAAAAQMDLTATYMMSGKEPELKGYYCYGVAVIEVELDVLTGRFQIPRADILEDVGLSASPNVDVGQVEGAYVMGLGYYTCEKLVYDKTSGKLLTNRSLTYHVPLALDIPVDFRVKLRYNSRNPKGVLGSKAVGEMGMCTAHGITHALRKAIMASRADSGYDPTQWIYIDIPYDTESILKALEVKREEYVFTK